VHAAADDEAVLGGAGDREYPAGPSDPDDVWIGLGASRRRRQVAGLVEAAASPDWCRPGVIALRKC
jgi:hypothetical protein